MNDSLRDSFKKSLRQVKNLPTLPGIVIKLTKMASDPDTTSEQMGKVIGRDHILAAKLLRLVNSAFYGFPQKISSISSAIILLGFNVIKSLIISASIFELMESNDLELWEHSMGCALACNVIAKRLGIQDPEEISTAGLIHDIGKVAIKIELPDQHHEILTLIAEKQIPMREAEREVLGLDHAEAGGWLAKNWNLPEKLIEPISCHHDPRNAKKEQVASSIIHFGDILIRSLGYGHAGDIWVPPLSKRAWQLLNLNRTDVDAILDEIEEKLWDIKGFSLSIQADLEKHQAGPELKSNAPNSPDNITG